MVYKFTYSNIPNGAKYEYEYLEMILQLLDSQDQYTYGHSYRVGNLSVSFGKYLNLPEKSIQELELAGYFHDIGKTRIPLEILNKKNPLTPEERSVIEHHPQIGFDIIENISSLYGILPAILYHHERYDGDGYPAGLKGSEIPYIARTISIADIFDAMMSSRPYRKKLAFENVLTELMDGRGKQFDPQLTDEFCNMVIVNGLYEGTYSR